MARLEDLPDPHSSPEMMALWQQAGKVAYRRVLRQTTLQEVVDAYADILASGKTVDEPDLTKVSPPPAWTLPFTSPGYPIPGLELRQLSVADLPEAWTTMYNAGMTGALGDKKLYEQVVEWFNSPDVWFLCLSYNGRPLQYEVLQFIPRTKEVWFAFTTHIDRERPSWFWAATEEPLFRTLQAEGYRVFSRSTARYPGWIDGLKLRYDVAVIEDQGDFQTLEFLLPGTLEKSKGWPAPVSVQGFTYTPLPGLEVREITQAEAEAAIETQWSLRATRSADENKATALRIVRERVVLDSATLLGGFRNGDLVSVLVATRRGPTTVGQATVTPFSGKGWSGRIQQGYFEWFNAAGYETVTCWFPRFQKDLIDQGRHAPRIPWTWGRSLSTGSTEAIANVKAVLGRPTSEWATDLPEPGA